ncbi:hypothetical protein F511_46281 [Dorcoceras hygrometricum]|uniref:Methionyl-tRNA synthetase n=1 Tax=Dorcoceras hygrometricum TaxID=472368 RepID=A0A2Z6ZTW3_9LAMI|nr:hypothetical protein F511_46281 [Dorcoceras hygrometricum]
MRLVYVCEEEDDEIMKEKAPGKCPKCGGRVEAVYVQSRGKFCHLPVCLRIKKKFFCAMCSKRLVLSSQLHPI